MIAHVAPGGWFHHHILSILGAHIYLGIILIIEPDDGAQGTVHPLVLDIILDKDNLCSGLQVQFDWGRQTAFRKLALDIAPEECWLSWQELELVLVDEIYGVAAGGEGDGKLGITLVELGTHPLVEQLKVLTLRLTGSDMVEDADEDRVALAINFLEFDADELELLEDLGIEEEAAAIERIQQFAVLLLYHRFQLIDVAHQQKLLSSERLPHIAAIHTQHLVDEIDDVGTHHTDLIDDDEFHFTDNLDFLGIILQCIPDVAHGIHTVVGQQGMEGQLEETVQGASAGIDGCDACRCQNDVFLLGIGCDVPQKSRFTRPRLSGEEKRTTGKLYDLECILQLRIVEINHILFLKVVEVDRLFCWLCLLLLFLFFCSS